MKQLKGKVVLVDFWEYTCVNCIRTLPYVKSWWAKYKDKGLVIVGIHTPEFKFAANRDNVAAAVQRFGLDFPILIDSGNKNWDAYVANYWPRKYLIDRNGRIVFDHVGEGGYGETEAKIQSLLREVNPEVQLPRITEPIRAEDRPGAVCYPETPELYVGMRGAENGQFGYQDYKIGDPVKYAFPADFKEGVIYLRGIWTPQMEFMEAATGSSLAIHFRANEANAVMRPATAATKLQVFEDGKPIDRKAAGPDVVFEGGLPVVHVNSPRMYALVKSDTWGEHDLELKALAPGLQVYSFTFSSTCKE